METPVILGKIELPIIERFKDNRHPKCKCSSCGNVNREDSMEWVNRITPEFKVVQEPMCYFCYDMVSY